MPTSEIKAEQGLSQVEIHETRLVDWDGIHDPENPLNWPLKRKWLTCIPMSLFNFIGAFISAEVAPALSTIQKDLGVRSDTVLILCLSIYYLPYAIGPMIAAPLSETFGRVRVLQLANVLFIITLLACALAHTPAQLIVFRFFSGLAGSVPQVICSGVIGDIFTREQRGKGVALYTIIPMIAPAIGPIVGGFIVTRWSWRVCFYSAAIGSGLVQLFGLFFLRETFGPAILKLKRDALRTSTGNNCYRTKHDSQSLAQKLRESHTRPFRMLARPLVLWLSIHVAYIYGIAMLMLATFPMTWNGLYGQPIFLGSLNYISIGVGLLVGIQVGQPVNALLYRKLTARNQGIAQPEFRLPLLFISCAFVPIGLFWYGWSAQERVHWIVPNIGAAIFVAGTAGTLQSIQTYVIDVYLSYSSSAMAAITILRSIAACALPLVAPAMFRNLEWGWGNSLLGFIALGFGVAAAVGLLRFGKVLREKSMLCECNA
ncbi:unnamed protein product [Cercospora beticola]|nr:unnamed protein product [Cercospora beticola]